MTGSEARDSRCERHARLRLEHRRSRLERRYRRLLALYPKDHRREHAEEMVGVLLAAAAPDGELGLPDLAGRARRGGQHVADCADLMAGALRIRSRTALNWIRRARWFTVMVRDPRWSDALAVVSVVAGTRLARRRASGRTRQVSSPGSSTGPPGAVRA